MEEVARMVAQFSAGRAGGARLWMRDEFQHEVSLGAYEDGAYQVPDTVTGFLDRGLWILGQSESQRALMWGSAVAFVLAVILAMGQRILTFGQTMISALRAARSLLFAGVILVLAWSLAATCDDLDTASPSQIIRQVCLCAS